MTELKTLKDMEGFFPSIIHGQAFAKTDLDLKGTTGNLILRDRLKEEAIKWVKEHLMYNPELDEWTLTDHMGTNEWMEFFNITEDDLK